MKTNVPAGAHAGARGNDAEQVRAGDRSGRGALGCVALDVDVVEGSKMDLEVAFRHAWSGWPYRSSFPVVRADVR